MADNRTPEERKRNMSAVRNKGSRAEGILLSLVMAEGLVGWRRNYKKAFGAPDLAFPKLKLAIFVDGCFWHGCRCKSIPQTNKDFWVHKIALNSERDALVVKRLRARGWTVWRIMEHELKRNKRECARQELLKAVAKVSINDPLD